MEPEEEPLAEPASWKTVPLLQAFLDPKRATISLPDCQIELCARQPKICRLTLTLAQTRNLLPSFRSRFLPWEVRSGVPLPASNFTERDTERDA